MTLADLVNMFHGVSASMNSNFNAGITPPAAAAASQPGVTVVDPNAPTVGPDISIGPSVAQVGTDNTQGPTAGGFVPTPQGGAGLNMGQIASLVSKAGAAGIGKPAAQVFAPAPKALPLVAASAPGSINWTPTK